MNLSKLGIYESTDYDKEEKVYLAGVDGQMPLALFLLYSSKAPKAVARFFNLIVHTEKAKKCENEFLKQKIDIQDLVDKFNQKEIDTNNPNKLMPINEDFFSKKSIQDINKTNYNVELELHLYAMQFADLIAMQTKNFEGTEGIIMTCPLSYIQYWNRPEFTQVYQVLENALIHILEDVFRIMKLRNIEVNPHSMTVSVNGYKAIQIRQSYMF